MLSLLISVAATALLPGQSTTLTISLDGGTAAGLQWNYACPGLTVGTWAVGAAASAAGKSVSTNPSEVIVSGLNALLISPGVVATVTITVPLNAVSGYAVISLSGPVAVDALGGSIPIAAGLPFTLIILPASVASVVSVPATASTAGVAPTLSVGANVQEVAAVTNGSALAPTVSVDGSPVVSPAVVISVAAVASAAAMLPGSLSLGSAIAPIAMRTTGQMPSPVISGNVITKGRGRGNRTPGIFKPK